ncbi:hypothetical protein A2768_01235 [Candidatus Roizmanbacteria bacterium RIFCSPHIGHO2_01_FULL_37_16]|nr:MAG: hypothetical protein A2768_01235 [Candidatus Roizmanbacteria bacterium RIFCSPHIGHO2_01_FULL_37_16]
MGRTHDLATITALSYVVATQPPQPITLATGITALLVGLVGGLTPDIDQPTADLWRKFPAGSVIGRIFYPFLGGHRNISHSIVGILFFAWCSKLLLLKIGQVLLVDMNVVWTAFMIGFVTHLIMDTFTQEGVPWLFPVPFKFGFPPLKFLRVKTASFMEKSVVFPGLLFLNAYIYYRFYDKFLDLLKHYIK